MNKMEEKVFRSFENDVQLYYCGKRIHNYSHRFGPYTDKKYLIYYIKEGRAALYANGKQTELFGQGFFVNFPESGTLYECEEGTPWSIKWIVVGGEMIEKYLSLIGITKDMPFVPISDAHAIEGVFDEMFELFDKESISSQIYCVSLLHKLFSLLADRLGVKKKKHPYVDLAEEIIERDYSDPELGVYEIAARLGLNANYFSMLYKSNKGISPLKALTAYRLDSAEKMLKFTNKPIRDIAYSSGFSDELYFSRLFRKTHGISPSKYRKREEIVT